MYRSRKRCGSLQKSPPPSSLPVVPLFALLLLMNIPATVAVPLMLKFALLAELSTLAAEIEPGVQVCRTDSEYAVTSVQLECEFITSAASTVPALF